MINHPSFEIAEILQTASFINHLAGQTILITGATGLIGSAIVEVVKLFNKTAQEPIMLVLLVRNIEQAKSKLNTNEHIYFLEGCIENIPFIKEEIDYIIHCASPTSSQDFIKKPANVLKTSLMGSFNIIELAKNAKIKKVLFLSSLEVYGTLDTFEAKETDHGVIDWTAARSSYIEAKRASESIFLSYYKQFNVPCIIARLPQILTSSFSYKDSRVYAQFVRAVKSQQNIVLKSKGETVRNYCYITDAIVGLLILLARGVPGEIYNVANEDTTCSIKEMAELLIEIEDNKCSQLILDLSDDPAKLGYLPTVKIKLLSDKLKRLGWSPRVGLKQSLSRMLSK